MAARERKLETQLYGLQVLVVNKTPGPIAQHADKLHRYVIRSDNKP